MRLFQEREKELMRRMTSDDGRNLYRLLTPWIVGACIYGDREKREVWVVRMKEPGVDLISSIDDMQRLVLECVHLIKMLAERNIVFTYQSSRVLPNEVNVGDVIIGHRMQHRIPDPTVAELFLKYAGVDIIPTPELKKFIRDGFITREEVRANRQFRTTLAAIGIAVLGLLLNIYVATRSQSSPGPRPGRHSQCSHGH